ncbi:MAG TPA: hypothetical protein VJL37_06405 [Flavobacterium sp.]|nr:hypothetical protein [Flavobacterium sp.]
MKQQLFILGFILLAPFAINAQEVVIEKDKVLLDGTPILKYEKINLINHSFYTLNDDEILNFRSFDNETPKYPDDDYYILNFINEKIKVESTDYSRIMSFMNSRKMCEKLVKWMLKDKVLNTDGTVNPQKLEVFVQKYHENITERTIR